MRSLPTIRLQSNYPSKDHHSVHKFNDEGISKAVEILSNLDRESKKIRERGIELSKKIETIPKKDRTKEEIIEVRDNLEKYWKDKFPTAKITLHPKKRHQKNTKF